MSLKREILRYSIAPIVIGIIIFLALSFKTNGFLSINNLKLNKNPDNMENDKIQRIGKIIKVKPDKLDYYKKLHADPWPEVLKAINECNIRNFSIYYKDGYLFSYSEYIGDDYKADMKKLSELTRNWLKETDPCQEPVESAKPGEWWSVMEEVFHTN